MGAYGFKGKHILFTGATGGMGSALVPKLIDSGASVVISGRSESRLSKLQKQFGGEDALIAIPADLARPGEADRLATEAVDALGHIDVLFNVAGIGYLAFMEESTDENVHHLFQINTFSPLSLMQKLAFHMKSRGGGRIINIVSTAGRVPIMTQGVYGASKTALAVMANTMRLELKSTGVDIINIYPGTTDTYFEQNAIRAKGKTEICPKEACGRPLEEMARKIFQTAAGPPGEAFLEWEGRLLAAAAILWPKYMEKQLEPLQERVMTPTKPKDKRKWRLWQIESALGCNLKCIMCPWVDFRENAQKPQYMRPEIWASLKPFLADVASIDFSGGGEPLMQPLLSEWIAEAKQAGCETGFLTNGTLFSLSKREEILDTGVDWIGFSMDGATREVYEKVRKGANFNRLVENIEALTRTRLGKTPHVLINFVILKQNSHQLEEMVKLAARLGVDQLNFKQCDVIRGDHGKGFGLFADRQTKEIRKLEKNVKRARRLARKLKIDVTTFAFTPEELPVCDQDPRNSVFIRCDGTAAPCINLAYGGPTTFLGESVTMPSVNYGNLTDLDLDQLWNTKTCQFYRERFQKRVNNHDAVIANSQFEASLPKLKETFQEALDAMPEAPEGCRVCHYLYDI